MIRRFILALVCLTITSSGQHGRVEADIITFDDVADGTIVNTRYPGVTFSNPIGGDIYARDVDRFAPSIPNVVSVVPAPAFTIFDARQGAVQARFTIPQSDVSIDARPVGPVEFFGELRNRPFLEAYDATNNFLGRVLYQGPLPTEQAFAVGPVERLIFRSPTSNISYIRFSSQQSQSPNPTYGLFDNLLTGADVVPIPEPASLTMLGIGLASLFGYARLRHRGKEKGQSREGYAPRRRP